MIILALTALIFLTVAFIQPLTWGSVFFGISAGFCIATAMWMRVAKRMLDDLTAITEWQDAEKEWLQQTMADRQAEREWLRQAAADPEADLPLPPRDPPTTWH
jgi:hypothetical protein